MRVGRLSPLSNLFLLILGEGFEEHIEYLESQTYLIKEILMSTSYMNIHVCNKYYFKGSNGIYVGRPSPLSNPFPFRSGEEVGEHIEYLESQVYFGNILIIPSLKKLLDIFLKEEELNLLCWCSPNRCHADSVKQILINKLEKGRFFLKEEYCKKPGVLSGD